MLCPLPRREGKGYVRLTDQRINSALASAAQVREAGLLQAAAEQQRVVARLAAGGPIQGVFQVWTECEKHVRGVRAPSVSLWLP
eukprot:141238-Chlamydomonas_euryale.AAC.2